MLDQIESGLNEDFTYLMDTACGSIDESSMDSKSLLDIKELESIQNKGWGCNSCPSEENYFSTLSIIGQKSLPDNQELFELMQDGTYLLR
jgi:hypothetical protein